MSRALIAMSGGVDSSVAASLMMESGWDCIGGTMRLVPDDLVPAGTAHGRSCCSIEDINDARAAANRLGIPHYVLNFTENFTQKVVDTFVSSYERGETPNPCIDCNKCIKFDLLLRRALELECDAMATGHYARIEREGERFLLKKAADSLKDQSYFLYGMSQRQLALTRFPLGGLHKEEVRALAVRLGLDNARKQDSQDICFVPDGDYGAFIERYRGHPAEPGPFVDGKGRILGRHRGLVRCTIGQRRGLGIALPRPVYVTAIRPEDNTVVLGDEDSLYSRTLIAKGINLIAVPRLDAPRRAAAKIRYRQEEQPARVWQADEDTLVVEFDQSQRAITPGQALVLYDGDVVIGGGTISRY
jgi:tRNA-specific 2-thiouridylase